MADAGDIHLADVGGGLRRRVLVVSTGRFHRAAERALVAPAVTVPADEPQPPWRIAVGADIFALDALRAVDLGQLLEPVGHADRDACERVRRALRAIT